MERYTKVAAKLRVPRTVLHAGKDDGGEEGLYCRKSKEYLGESALAGLA